MFKEKIQVKKQTFVRFD